MAFPNLFEFWFLVIAGFRAKQREIKRAHILWVLLVILAAKLFHEWVLHFAMLCDTPYFNICGLERMPVIRLIF